MDNQKPDHKYTESMLVNRFPVEGNLFDMEFRGSLLTHACETLTDCESRLITNWPTVAQFSSNPLLILNSLHQTQDRLNHQIYIYFLIQFCTFFYRDAYECIWNFSIVFTGVKRLNRSKGLVKWTKRSNVIQRFRRRLKKL